MALLNAGIIYNSQKRGPLSNYADKARSAERSQYTFALWLTYLNRNLSSSFVGQENFSFISCRSVDKRDDMGTVKICPMCVA